MYQRMQASHFLYERVELYCRIETTLCLGVDPPNNNVLEQHPHVLVSHSAVGGTHGRHG